MNWKLRLFLCGCLSIFIGWYLGWPSALAVLVAIAAIFFIQSGIIVVPEMEVWILFNRQRKSFTRFLYPGFGWCFPKLEYIHDRISTKVTVAKGSCQALTREGHLLSIDWMLTYQLVPENIAEDRQPGMARVLPSKADMLAKTSVNDCIRDLIEQRSIGELLEIGVQSRLKRDIRQRTSAEMMSSGFQVYRVTLGAKLPERVSQTIEDAHRRLHQAQVDAEVYQIIRQSLDAFSDDDMRRLMELERIRTLAQSAKGTYIYSYNDESHFGPDQEGSNGRRKEQFHDLPLAQ